MAPPNPTGFDMKEFVRASTSTQWRSKDPWKRNEAWRSTGPFTRWNRFKGAFPGFGIAVGAFAVYLVAEQVFFKDEHHGDGHGKDHH
ncbi:uncharacterized protein HMPREF1541_05218 [Cyphellophora europaea CBS 101466]|uniref:NADH-ubiquinone oxidoreductase B12 subunit n=1 Tax=Cyphellophora europaea (strain CBS 101466) TaxID=1220924 RepID=W2RYV0_CYPE1|nr:uncharacterized protein HMPREF1541_05218 [Cyphellophora europaea CBS 101466]ETN40938.1 hypothetical protein HMPREF1541_05218 [Cyphellophora europaea CBS 101466]